MLSVLRRNVGWTIKLTLGIIALTFVFYFGFTQLGNQIGTEGSALIVGKETIPFSQFRFFFGNALDLAQEQFQGEELPDFYRNMLKEQTRQRLVYRTLATQFSRSLALKVTDRELADFITKNPDFDPVSYKQYLEYFYNQNGLVYEQMIRQDLLIQKFQDLSKTHQKTSLLSENSPTWVFQTLILTGKEKEPVARQIQAAWREGKEPKALLKKDGLEPKEGRPVTLEEKEAIFGRPLTAEQSLLLFSLTPEHPGLQEPIVQEESFLLARLKERKEPQDPRPVTDPEFSLFDLWFRDTAQKTTVTSLLPEEL